MSARRAFVILGPESSGTRLMARLFIRAGAHGDYEHRQRLDAMLSNGDRPTHPVVVVRRSYPYSKEWPNLGKLKGRLERAGYEVRAVVVLRSLQFTALSSNRQMHTRSREHGIRRSTEAFKHIGTALAESGLPFVWLTYESLVQRPEQELTWLFQWAGLPAPLDVEIFDGNAKY